MDHGVSMAEDTMQAAIATETPVPFAGADIQSEEVGNNGKKEKESRKKVTKKIIFDSPVSYFCHPCCLATTSSSISSSSLRSGFLEFNIFICL